jgi:spore germination protein KB
MRDIIELVRIFLIENMPVFIICFCFLLALFYVISKGVEVMSRLFTLFFAIFAFLYLTMMTANIIINKPDLSFLFPILEDGFKPVVKPAFEMSYAIPFGELFTILIMYQYVKDKKKKQKVALAGILASGIALLMITFLNITIFGPGAMAFGLNPSIELAALIDVKNFIQRLDIILVCILGFHTFVKVSIMVFCSQLLLKQVFKAQQKQWVPMFFICIIIFIAVSFFTKNYFTLIRFREMYVIPYVCLVFEVIIPALLIIISFFRKPKEQKNEFTI